MDYPGFQFVKQDGEKKAVVLFYFSHPDYISRHTFQIVKRTSTATVTYASLPDSDDTTLWIILNSWTAWNPFCLWQVCFVSLLQYQYITFQILGVKRGGGKIKIKIKEDGTKIKIKIKQRRRKRDINGKEKIGMHFSI